MADKVPPSAHAGAAFPRRRRLGVILIGWATLTAAMASGQDIERDPINYSASTPRNAITRLQDRLAAGTAKLEFDPEHGYLPSLLRALDVPQSSQMLVFSKTSLQRDRISPKTPRAIYFNDDVMVGFCYRGRAIELSAPDDALGTAYYTLDQTREEKTVLERQTESCLICHSSSVTRGFPGHLVRSVFADPQGNPLLSSGSFRTDHTSPLAERWGGWYVTGTSGRQKHMGNMICQGPRGPEDFANADGVNVVDLKDRFTTSFYPTPTSDIVALMVFEHQVGMLNRLAQAGVETRMALHYELEFNKALGQPADEPSTSARSRIRSVGEAVVKYMLFAEEAPLTDRVGGTSTFASDFVKRGPRDSQGRSLRDLDLDTRLFRYPCSYLIYSRAFDSLPGAVKAHIYQRLWDILDGRNVGKDDPALLAEDRKAILEILRATKSDLPDYWKAGVPPAPASRGTHPAEDDRATH
jgi:hypothetical protein